MMSRMWNTIFMNSGFCCITRAENPARHRHVVENRAWRRRDDVRPRRRTRLLYGVGDEKDRGLRLAGEPDEHVLHVEPGTRVQRSERAVHEHDFGLRMSDRAIATRWRFRRKLVRYSLHRGRLEPHLPNPFACALPALLRRYPLTLEPEGNVVLDRPVVERRVVLKYHAPVSAWFHHRLSQYLHRPGCRRELWAKPRDHSQNRGLAASRWPEDGDDLHLVGFVVNLEGDVANGGEAVVERLAYLVELHDQNYSPAPGQASRPPRRAGRSFAASRKGKNPR